MTAQSEFVQERFVWSEGAAGQNQQPNAIPIRCSRNNLQQKIDALDRPEIGHVHHEELVRDSKLTSYFCATLRWLRRREEIRNDLDLFTELKGLFRLLPDTFRN